MISNDSTVWEDTLLAVEEGQAVPVIGRDLLVVDTETGPQRYHRLVAERLAAELKIPTDHLPPEFDTNDVICAYEKFHGDSTGFSPRVVRIVKELKVPLPEALLRLAQISKFNLFVSTTCDTLLEEAIFKVRGRRPAAVAFPATSSLTDFDDALLEQHGSLVFQVLGRVSASAPFALTEGQILEQMHNFMSGPQRPDKLIARLKESHLLMLGVAFPDWLSRFLLRFARAKPLWDSLVSANRSPHPQNAQCIGNIVVAQNLKLDVWELNTICRRCSEISGAGSDDQNCRIPLWVSFSVHCEHSGNSWEWRLIFIVHWQNRFGGVNSMRILRLLWDVIFPFQIVWPHRSRDHFGHYSRLAGFNTNAIMRVIYEQDEDFENRR